MFFHDVWNDSNTPSSEGRAFFIREHTAFAICINFFFLQRQKPPQLNIHKFVFLLFFFCCCIFHISINKVENLHKICYGNIPYEVVDAHECNESILFYPQRSSDHVFKLQKKLSLIFILWLI